MARIEIWKRGEVEGNRREAPDEWEEEKVSQVKEDARPFSAFLGPAISRLPSGEQ
jgi:hypothetical protein